MCTYGPSKAADTPQLSHRLPLQQHHTRKKGHTDTNQAERRCFSGRLQSPSLPLSEGWTDLEILHGTRAAHYHPRSCLSFPALEDGKHIELLTKAVFLVVIRRCVLRGRGWGGSRVGKCNVSQYRQCCNTDTPLAHCCKRPSHLVHASPPTRRHRDR